MVNAMNRAAIGLALVLVGCSPSAPVTEGEVEPAPVVTVTKEAEPAPAVTVTKEAEPDPEEKADQASAEILQMVWDDISSDERDGICALFWIDEDMAWDSFNEGAEDMFTRRAFNKFFSGVC